jgi:hypothetical protein
MVNKRAYLKTLEAVISIVIFLIFITVALVFSQTSSKPTLPKDIETLQDTIITKIESEQALRTCLANNQTDCINQTINPLIPSRTTDYQFDICVTDTPLNCPSPPTFPTNITIYTDSLIIQEANQSAIFRLFLWKKI